MCYKEFKKILVLKITFVCYNFFKQKELAVTPLNDLFSACPDFWIIRGKPNAE